MAKTLKQFKQGYTPRSADEKKFVDKHTVQKTPDANGNGDDVFKATNVKKYDRELEHGYNSGSDEEVYEHVSSVSSQDVNEGAPALIAGAGLAGLAGYFVKRAGEKIMGSDKIKRRIDKEEEKALQPANPSKQPVVEKKLTPAEMKKREEVAKAIERENPNMPMAKKMAIATATAKKVAEATDVPFEGPYKKKTDAHGPKSRAKHLAKMAMKKVMDKAVQDAAVAGLKKKVNETDLKDYLLSVYASQLSEEDNQVLQEMLETEEGTKIAFMVSMLVDDKNVLDEMMKKSEKYSHRSFLNKLKTK